VNFRRLSGILIILAVTFGLYYAKTYTPHAKPTSFEKEFRDVKLPLGARPVVYAMKGKDLYGWAKVEMDKTAFENFVNENGLTNKLTMEPQVLKTVSEEVQLLTKFNPELKADWWEDGFTATGVVRNTDAGDPYGSKILVGESNRKSERKSVVYFVR